MGSRRSYQIKDDDLKVRHPGAFHAFRNGKREAKDYFWKHVATQSPAFTRAGACLHFANLSVLLVLMKLVVISMPLIVRVAAVAKLENLSDVDAHRDLVSC